MAIALTYLLWIAYACFEGHREASYFSYKMRTSIAEQKVFGKDEHFMFSVQRALVLGMALLSCDGWIDIACMFFACAFSFPFFHDGFYYVRRNDLDRIYPKRWFDQSKSSTALSDKLGLFNPISRTALFGVSILIVTYILIIMK